MAILIAAKNRPLVSDPMHNSPLLDIIRASITPTYGRREKEIDEKGKYN